MPPRKARQGDTSSTTSTSSKATDAGEGKVPATAQKRPRKARKKSAGGEAATPAQSDTAEGVAGADSAEKDVGDVKDGAQPEPAADIPKKSNKRAVRRKQSAAKVADEVGDDVTAKHMGGGDKEAADNADTKTTPKKRALRRKKSASKVTDATDEGKVAGSAEKGDGKDSGDKEATDAAGGPKKPKQRAMRRKKSVAGTTDEAGEAAAAASTDKGDASSKDEGDKEAVNASDSKKKSRKTRRKKSVAGAADEADADADDSASKDGSKDKTDQEAKSATDDTKKAKKTRRKKSVAGAADEADADADGSANKDGSKDKTDQEAKSAADDTKKAKKTRRKKSAGGAAGAAGEADESAAGTKVESAEETASPSDTPSKTPEAESADAAGDNATAVAPGEDDKDDVSDSTKKPKKLRRRKSIARAVDAADNSVGPGDDQDGSDRKGDEEAGNTTDITKTQKNSAAGSGAADPADESAAGTESKDDAKDTSNAMRNDSGAGKGGNETVDKDESGDSKVTDAETGKVAASAEDGVGVRGEGTKAQGAADVASETSVDANSKTQDHTGKGTGRVTQKEEQKDAESGDGALQVNDKDKARARRHKHRDASKDTAEHKDSDKRKEKKRAKEKKHKEGYRMTEDEMKAKDGGKELPAGWIRVASHSRKGEISYKNTATGHRQKRFPDATDAVPGAVADDKDSPKKKEKDEKLEPAGKKETKQMPDQAQEIDAKSDQEKTEEQSKNTQSKKEKADGDETKMKETDMQRERVKPKDEEKLEVKRSETRRRSSSRSRSTTGEDKERAKESGRGAGKGSTKAQGPRKVRKKSVGGSTGSTEGASASKSRRRRSTRREATVVAAVTAAAKVASAAANAAAACASAAQTVVHEVQAQALQHDLGISSDLARKIGSSKRRKKSFIGSDAAPVSANLAGTKRSESATLAAGVPVNGSSEHLSSALEGPEQHEQGVDDRQRERLRQREELLSFLTESDGTALDTMEFAQVAHAVDADTSTTFLTPALQRDAAVGAARRQQKEAAAAAVAAAKAAEAAIAAAEAMPLTAKTYRPINGMLFGQQALTDAEGSLSAGTEGNFWFELDRAGRRLVYFRTEADAREAEELRASASKTHSTAYGGLGAAGAARGPRDAEQHAHTQLLKASALEIGAIDLDGVTLLDAADSLAGSDGGVTKAAFELFSVDAMWMLSAESARDKNRWVKAIEFCQDPGSSAQQPNTEKELEQDGKDVQQNQADESVSMTHAGSAVAAQAQDEVWVEHIDPSSGQHFWFSRTTRKCTFDRPTASSSADTSANVIIERAGASLDAAASMGSATFSYLRDPKSCAEHKYLVYETCPEFEEGNTSLLAQMLAPEMWDRLQGRMTPKGYTLSNLVQPGVECKGTGIAIGVAAGDAESYELFAELLDQLIAAWHGFSPQSEPHVHDRDATKLRPTPALAAVAAVAVAAEATAAAGTTSPTSTTTDVLAPAPPPAVPAATEQLAAAWSRSAVRCRCRASRNIRTYSMPAGTNDEERAAVEGLLSRAAASLDGDFHGRYLAFDGISGADDEYLHTYSFKFSCPDPSSLLGMAGGSRRWPQNRGVYHNDANTALIWVNEEDHARIITMQEDGDLIAAFTRWVALHDALESRLMSELGDPEPEGEGEGKIDDEGKDERKAEAEGSDKEKDKQENVQKQKRESPFAMHDRLGYLTTCPSNLGSAFRASIDLRLPCLTKEPEQLHGICKENGLHAILAAKQGTTGLQRDVRGASPTPDGGSSIAETNADSSGPVVWEVSNRLRLGKGASEVELVQQVVNGATALVLREAQLFEDERRAIQKKREAEEAAWKLELQERSQKELQALRESMSAEVSRQKQLYERRLTQQIQERDAAHALELEQLRQRTSAHAKLATAAPAVATPGAVNSATLAGNSGAASQSPTPGQTATTAARTSPVSSSVKDLIARYSVNEPTQRSSPSPPPVPSPSAGVTTPHLATSAGVTTGAAMGASPPTAAAAVAAAVAAGGATSVATSPQLSGNAGNSAMQQVPDVEASPQSSDAATPSPSPPPNAADTGRESPVTEKDAAKPDKQKKRRMTQKLSSMFRTVSKKKTDDNSDRDSPVARGDAVPAGDDAAVKAAAEASDNKLGVNGDGGSEPSATSAANGSTLNLLRAIAAGGNVDTAPDAVSAAGTESEKSDKEQKAANTLRKGLSLFKRKKNAAEASTAGNAATAGNAESDARSGSPVVAVTADRADVAAAGPATAIASTSPAAVDESSPTAPAPAPKPAPKTAPKPAPASAPAPAGQEGEEVAHVLSDSATKRTMFASGTKETDGSFRVQRSDAASGKPKLRRRPTGKPLQAAGEGAVVAAETVAAEVQSEAKTTQGAASADADAKNGIGVQVAHTTLEVADVDAKPSIGVQIADSTATAEEEPDSKTTAPELMQSATSAGAAFFADA